MHAAMAHRRALEGLRRQPVRGEAEFLHGRPGRRRSGRPRQVAEVLEEARPVGPLRDAPVLGLGEARGDEVPRRARLVDGGDGAEARAGERPGALHHLVEHGLKVQARADAQARRAERGDARAQRLVFGRRRLAVGHRFLPASVAGALPARPVTDSLADRSPGSGGPASVRFQAYPVESVMNSCELHEIPPRKWTRLSHRIAYNCKGDIRARGVPHGGRAGRVEWARPPGARNRVRGAKGRQAVRELGDRNGSFVGVRRHRREQGIVDLQGGCRAIGTDRPRRGPMGARPFPRTRLPPPHGIRAVAPLPPPPSRDPPAKRTGGSRGPAGRRRAAGPDRARAGPDHGLERHPHPRRPQRFYRLQQRQPQRQQTMQHRRRPLRGRVHARLHQLHRHLDLPAVQRKFSAQSRHHRNDRDRGPHPGGRQHHSHPRQRLRRQFVRRICLAFLRRLPDRRHRR